MRQEPIPIVDLFAGPGGLGEGFASLYDREMGRRRFGVGVSIEKDPIAHRTLSLRALYRAFPPQKVPETYYRYIRGEINREDLFSASSMPQWALNASSEARNAELGKTSPDLIDEWIADAISDATEWVLIGGPPCQAYSIAGRSRRTNESQDQFESDEKHFLYKEYLRIIQRFQPTVFVMENVKGLLTSRHGGTSMFPRILDDLANPGGDYTYEVRSFASPGPPDTLAPSDYVIEAERFGIPQSRHRVILFGIRSDIVSSTPALSSEPSRFVLKPRKGTLTVSEALQGMPAVRSRLSREVDSASSWRAALQESSSRLSRSYKRQNAAVVRAMNDAVAHAAGLDEYGSHFVT